jgi:hypothetical protein
MTIVCNAFTRSNLACNVVGMYSIQTIGLVLEAVANIDEIGEV